MTNTRPKSSRLSTMVWQELENQARNLVRVSGEMTECLMHADMPVSIRRKQNDALDAIRDYFSILRWWESGRDPADFLGHKATTISGGVLRDPGGGDWSGNPPKGQDPSG